MVANNCTNKSFKAWEMRIDAVQIPEVIVNMGEWIKKKDFGNYIVIANANDAVLSRNDSNIREAANNSSLSVPDGISLVFLAKLYGYSLKERVYGQALMFEFLKLAEKNGYSNFFYGSTEETLDLLVNNLKKQFPRLKIAGTYSPPFRELSEQEDREISEKINKASPDALWVGLGCPKQQFWMHRHKYKLKVPVMVGVGAAFDFIAGTKLQAPVWMRNNGLEWLFRLLTEPRRLWKRYLIGNTLFLGLFLREFIKRKIFKIGELKIKKCLNRNA